MCQRTVFLSISTCHLSLTILTIVGCKTKILVKFAPFQSSLLMRMLLRSSLIISLIFPTLSKVAICRSGRKFIFEFFFLLQAATFGNPSAGGATGGQINNGSPNTIKLEAHTGTSAAHSGSNYYTCATYGSPSPGANEHHQPQSLLASSAYSKFLKI